MEEIFKQQSILLKRWQENQQNWPKQYADLAEKWIGKTLGQKNDEETDLLQTWFQAQGDLVGSIALWTQENETVFLEISGGKKLVKIQGHIINAGNRLKIQWKKLAEKTLEQSPLALNRDLDLAMAEVQQLKRDMKSLNRELKAREKEVTEVLEALSIAENAVILSNAAAEESAKMAKAAAVEAAKIAKAAGLDMAKLAKPTPKTSIAPSRSTRKTNSKTD